MESVEEIVFNGKIYRRYPNSQKREHRVYYTSNGFEETPVSLHRAIYEKHYGKIPEGYHVHHKDGNPLNNDPSNLEAISTHQHLSEHVIKNFENPVYVNKKMAALEKARLVAPEWHRSEEGIKWHSENAKRVWSLRTAESRVCDQCGATFDSMTHRKSDRFCSNNCKSKWRRESGIDNESRECLVCKKQFVINKYSKVRTCSRDCGNVVSGLKRRKHKRVD